MVAGATTAGAVFPRSRFDSRQISRFRPPSALVWFRSHRTRRRGALLLHVHACAGLVLLL